MAARRSLRVALLGLTNSGKSTLCNALVGEEVSIATPKRHTTRTNVRAIVVEGDTQVVLTDTPGVLELSKGSRRERARNRADFRPLIGVARDALWEARLHLLVVDAAALDSRHRAAHTGRELARLRSLAIESLPPRVPADSAADAGGGSARAPTPCVLALNKVDRLRGVAPGHTSALADLVAHGGGIEPCATFEISARTGAGVAALKQYLVGAARPGEWEFDDPSQRTDLTLGERALELLRAALHGSLRHQLAYVCRQEGAHWREEGARGQLALEVTLSMPGRHELAILRSALPEIVGALRPRLRTLFDREVRLTLRCRMRSKRS